MRRSVVLALLATSCAGNPQQEAARGAFEQWRQALLAGDAEKTFQMMSTGLRAQWLFDSLSAEDREAREWRRALAGSARTDLDLWIEFNRSHPNQRVVALPPTVSAHPSLTELYRRYFLQELATWRQRYSAIQVAEVWTDSTGASIAVKNTQGTTEMFQFIPESDGWKLDHYKSSIRHLPR